MGPILTGHVSAFDEAAGLGTLVGSDRREWSLHCTAIADGSRTIDVGTAVAFVLGPAHGGRWEPRCVTPLGPDGPQPGS